MSATVTVTANNVRNACAAARKYLGLSLKDSKVKLTCPEQGSLYRIHLTDGTIIEATIMPRAKATVHFAY